MKINTMFIDLAVNTGIYLITIILYLWGGQLQKWVRRIILPSAYTLWKLIQNPKIDKNYRWRSFFLLLLIPLLSMGYGIDSSLMKVLKKEWLVRLAYATFLYIPFALMSVPIWGLIALILAFQVRIDKSIADFYKGYDIIYDDIVRAIAIGYNFTFLV